MNLNSNMRDETPVVSSSVYRLVIVVSALLLFGISCEETFQPFETNDKFNFTMFGFLDASADTQWVRVSPVREKFESLDYIPEMNIILQQVENGTSVTMNKSLIPFQEGFNAVNAWSDLDIEPGKKYQLTAETPDGEISTVTVTVPTEFPTPRLAKIERPTLEPEYILLIENVKYLVDVQSRWYTRVSSSNFVDNRLFTFSNNENVRIIGTDRYTVSIDPDEERERIERESLISSLPDGKIEILRHQLFIASGGPEWDERIPTMDDVTYALPESVSNVENGLGYVIGIYSKTIPFQNCTDDREVPIPCDEEDPFW